MHTLCTFIEGIEKNIERKISRVLFNSTGQLPERFPLLDRDPLLFTALVRILKGRGIGLMIIGVEGAGRDDRITALSEMSDLKVTVHHPGDERLSKERRTDLARLPSGSRLVSSDNITGKDYKKKYQNLQINPGEEEEGDQISLVEPVGADS